MKPITFAILIFIASLGSPALAAMANPPGPQNAIYVIVGTVVGVYESIKTGRYLITTNHVVAIRIKEIEKGEGLKNGDLLYAHYWQQGPPPGAPPIPHESGYRGRMPKEGETLRVYLTRKDGEFNVVLRDGFEGLGQGRKL